MTHLLDAEQNTVLELLYVKTAIEVGGKDRRPRTFQAEKHGLPSRSSNVQPVWWLREQTVGSNPDRTLGGTMVPTLCLSVPICKMGLIQASHEDEISFAWHTQNNCYTSVTVLLQYLKVNTSTWTHIPCANFWPHSHQYSLQTSFTGTQALKRLKPGSHR